MKLPGQRRAGGYPRPKSLRKYSYPTGTFVILTALRLAVGLGWGAGSISVPHPPQGEVNCSLPWKCLPGGPGNGLALLHSHWLQEPWLADKSLWIKSLRATSFIFRKLRVFA